MSFCPECGEKLEDGAKFCGECGFKLEGLFDEQIEPKAESMPWEQDVDEEPKSEKMPWEQDVEEVVIDTPWEQNVEEEIPDTPWEQNVEEEVADTPWEQNVEEEVADTPWDQNVEDEVSEEIIEEDEEEVEEEEPKTPLRPSQMKKAREQEKKSGQITIKKLNLDVKSYKEKAKSLTKQQIIVIAEALILVVIIGIFCAIGSSKGSPDSVAKNYVEAYSKGDWEEIYELIDLPESDFLAKEQFIQLKQKAVPLNISTYEVIDQPFAGSSLERYYVVNCTVPGQGATSFELRLVKQSDKTMLFFDSWKVSEFGIVAEKYPIYVPAGAEVALDGYLLEESDMVMDDDYTTDLYQITMFAGDHKIQINQPWCALYEEEFTVYSGDSYHAYNFVLSEEGEKAIQASMQNALERCYQAAAGNKDFSEVEDLFMPEYVEECRAAYNYLVEDLHGSPRYSLNSVTFSNFGLDYYLEGGSLQATLSYNYFMNYTYRSSYSNESSSRTDDGRSEMYASFVFDGETYKIAGISLRSVL